MSETIIVSLLSLAGTLGGSIIGILTANRLVQYRLEQLEKKVQAHNNLVERMFIVEGKIEEVQHEISDLKEYHRP